MKTWIVFSLGCGNYSREASIQGRGMEFIFSLALDLKLISFETIMKSFFSQYPFWMRKVVIWWLFSDDLWARGREPEKKETTNSGPNKGFSRLFILMICKAWEASLYYDWIMVSIIPFSRLNWVKASLIKFSLVCIGSGAGVLCYPQPYPLG